MKDLTKLLFLLLLIAAAASCEKKETEITDSGRTHDKISETNVKTGSLRVKMQKGFTVSDTSMLHTKASGINILSMKRTFPYCGKFEKRTHEAGLDRWYDIKFDKSYSLTKASETISDIDGVEQIETIPKIKITGNSLPFDDPDLSDQWQYENTGSKSFETAGADINLFDAWTLETGDPSVIVAVVDGGVDYSHEDLAANMWINQAEYNGTKGVDDDGNGVIDDIYGYNTINRSGTIIPGDHGTHVAGTIAAVNNNGIGVCGVAGGNGNSNSGV
ncbi:MAG: S8 family serine peptidase, partial [Bacteroidales bacterium]|nr:S8 family serine peptidase [Bacteroidales bacterium]